MQMRILLSAGFIFHTVLGTFCMIPMAYAMESPIGHTEHEEIAMTPITPVSAVHCTDCATTELRTEHVPPMSPSCTGHCLAQAKDAAMGALVLTPFQVPHATGIVRLDAWKWPSSFSRSDRERPPDDVTRSKIILRV